MSKKILVIEDDNTLRGLIVQKMKQELYETHEAIDAFETFSFLKTHTVDLIILDLMLPEIDGYEILKQLRQKDETLNTSVIVFSNLSDENKIEKATALGASAFLIKTNVSLQDLAEKVKEVLGK